MSLCWKCRVVIKLTSGVPSQSPPPFPCKECQEGLLHQPQTSGFQPSLALQHRTSCCLEAGNSFQGCGEVRVDVGQALLRAASTSSPESHKLGYMGQLTPSPPQCLVLSLAPISANTHLCSPLHPSIRILSGPLTPELFAQAVPCAQLLYHSSCRFASFPRA